MRLLKTIIFIAAVIFLGGSVAEAQDNIFWLDGMNLSGVYQEWGAARAKSSVEGNPLRIGGTEYGCGIGSHARSEIIIDLKGSALKFEASVGVDDEKNGAGSVIFQVWADGAKKFDSGRMLGNQQAKDVSVDLKGARKLVLRVTDAGDGISCDHANWADARLELDPQARAMPAMFRFRDEEELVIARNDPEKLGIHGPRVTGATPGKPFLFLIPATGSEPLAYFANNLPEGLLLDKNTGIIFGAIKDPGAYDVELIVMDTGGTTRRRLKIVCGENKLCLTPPMGWNSWNIWGGDINENRVRKAADCMVSGGLAKHGFQYINIDDCWQGQRNKNGAMLPNKKFKNMRDLADYVHDKGLKFGVYSSPGPKTCAGFEGSEGYEEQDAQAYARWGVDYLKYDWCSCRSSDLKKPYRIMSKALGECGRDIVFSLCQYGMDDVWKWGESVGGNLWRTTGDIQASWQSMSMIWDRQETIGGYAGPGHWNDPDMMIIGVVGAGNPKGRAPTPLTRNEQITHVTLWCMLSAPLLLGCDLTRLDTFTIDLLSNDEVLDVNQDELGIEAKCVSREKLPDETFSGAKEVWAKPLFDNTFAVGLFNRGLEKSEIIVKWSDIGLKGSQVARDLWQQKDLGMFSDSFSVVVPGHGVRLLKIGTAKTGDK